jgi:hypothetical protein
LETVRRLIPKCEELLPGRSSHLGDKPAGLSDKDHAVTSPCTDPTLWIQRYKAGAFSHRKIGTSPSFAWSIIQVKFSLAFVAAIRERRDGPQPNKGILEKGVSGLASRHVTHVC